MGDTLFSRLQAFAVAAALTATPLAACAVARMAHPAAKSHAAASGSRSSQRGHASVASHSGRTAHGAPVARTAAGRAAGSRSSAARSRNVVVLVRGRHGRMVRTRYVEHFSAPSFTSNTDSTTQGDLVAGEDPLVRASLLEALGAYNGTALAIDPKNGRILAMVNQKLALGPGAEPCSTIKLTVALAALSEGIITKDTPVNLGHGYRLNLTYALARSVNPYFETLGREMGFQTVKHYANQFGLGELAGYNVAGEQLGAIVAAIANGGSLFYLQHPTTPDEVAAFEPRLKRTLDIARYIPDMLPGMAGAVEANYGTARSLRANFNEFPVFGKTGTCSDAGTRFGWFASYGDGPNGRIVTVFFLNGGRPTFGPKAAELTGVFYRALASRSYFQQHAVPATDTVTVPATTVATPSAQHPRD